MSATLCLKTVLLKEWNVMQKNAHTSTTSTKYHISEIATSRLHIANRNGSTRVYRKSQRLVRFSCENATCEWSQVPSTSGASNYLEPSTIYRKSQRLGRFFCDNATYERSQVPSTSGASNYLTPSSTKYHSIQAYTWDQVQSTILLIRPLSKRGVEIRK
jgi:membrane-bound inhibitor of C-type lysozyme